MDDQRDIWSNVTLPLGPSCPASGLPLIDQLFQTLDTVPFTFWNLFDFQTFQMEHFRTSITTNHLPILPTYFALILAFRFLFFIIFFLLIFIFFLLGLYIWILYVIKKITIWNLRFFRSLRLGRFEFTIYYED